MTAVSVFLGTGHHFKVNYYSACKRIIYLILVGVACSNRLRNICMYGDCYVILLLLSVSSPEETEVVCRPQEQRLE